MFDMSDDFLKFTEHLRMRRDRWIAAGAWGKPDLKDCILFMLTEAREAQKLVEQGSSDGGLSLAMEAFDCLMMAIFALEAIDLSVIWGKKKLSDMGDRSEMASEWIQMLLAEGLDALEEVMRLDARYYRNDRERQADLFFVAPRVLEFARISAGLIVVAGHSPVEIAQRKLAAMDEKRGLIEL